ncbi:MAG: preprotein translocase subunit SecA [Puniceicoccales bacterium]|nr:preprotein translocase subunit SecA [Puniceicoccales bacterium]
MLNQLFKRFAGRHYRKFWKECDPIVKKINTLEEQYRQLPEEALKSATERFKTRYRNGESLDQLLPETFATVKNAARRLMGKQATVCGHNLTWNMIHYDVQLIGGIALHRGYIAEMATGEGKTLVATLPLYLNALTGKNCQLVTVNDYLAKRDSEWMGILFEYLGVSVGCIQHDMAPVERSEAYKQDITYGTASEFGFDYLRDNGMAFRAEDQVQRKHYFCIVDEVDSILIDEARTPLIISGISDEESGEEAFLKLKPGVQRLFRLQNDLCSDLVEEAKPKLEASDKDPDFELALEKLYQVKAGSPKNRQLLHLLESGKIRRAFDKFETQMVADFNRDRAYKLKENLYYTIDERNQQADLTEKGRNTLQPNDPHAFTLPDLPAIFSEIDAHKDTTDIQKQGLRQEAENIFSKRSEVIHCLSQLLRAYTLYEKDDQYVVMDGKVVIIDENTGRAMPGRRWSEGLHQAIEAKEGVHLEKESKTYATITLQNYFRMYEKLAGMTGTAETEAQEFFDIYKLKVMSIPTHRPCIRHDDNDVIYKTRRAKYRAVIQDIEEAHGRGQPILVGTASVEASEVLSKMLKHLHIPHNVLNAKYHQQEAEIVEYAGQRSAVTIATNMAGRGTDIKLGEGVSALGGLFVLGTERHESRRIDRQLRGRCSRQGDPGRSKFFVSLEDDLMRLFANAGPIGAFLEKSMSEDEELTHPFLNRSIQSAQKKVEQHNYTIRKRLLQYDDVLNRQREIIYGLRNEALSAEQPLLLIWELVEDEIDHRLEVFEEEPIKRTEVLRNFLGWLNLQFPIFLTEEMCVDKTKAALRQNIIDTLKNNYAAKQEIEGETSSRQLERWVLVSAIDKNWQDQLTEMEDLRQSVNLRGYGQKDPLIEYKNEAYHYFELMIANIRQAICFQLFRASTRAENLQKTLQTIHRNIRLSGAQDPAIREDDMDLPKPMKRTLPKVGRNDLCPCGSGKKFKKCCGVNADEG